MSHFEGWQDNLELDKLYLGSDQWTKMQEPSPSTTESTQSTADTGPKFSEKSFEMPYGARSARFYEWRQSLIDKAADILVDTDVKLASMAQEDMYTEMVYNEKKVSQGHRTKLVEVRQQRDTLKATLEARIQQLEADNTALRTQLTTTQSQQLAALTAPSGRLGVFTAKSSSLPQFFGERDAEKVITFLCALERAFHLRASETSTSGSTRHWAEYRIQCLKGKAAEWAHITWFLEEDVEWGEFKDKLAEHFIPADAAAKLHAAFANLAWDPKTPLAQFNDDFKALRQKIRIITKSRLDDKHDAGVIESYLTKIQNTCLKEKNNGPALGVYAVFTSWEACWGGAQCPILTKIMTFLARQDDTQNRHTAYTLSHSLVSPSPHPLTTSQGGDVMDIYKAEVKGGNRRAWGRDRPAFGKGSGKDRKGRELKGDEKKQRGDEKKEDHDSEWLRKQCCYHCGTPGYLKKDCKGHKKLIAALERRDAKITEVVTSDKESGKD